MLDYKLIHALAAVIQEGGFDKASQVLNITQSAVSQRIKLLEDQVGRLLVTRTTPPLATPQGKRILKHYIQVKNLEADLNQALDPGESNTPRTFSIGINADSLATWFLPAVRDFCRDHRILLDLKVDDQDETHKLLRQGEVAGCISSEKTPVQGCRVTVLGTMNYRMVSTRSFRQAHFPNGFDAAGLASAPAALFNRKDDLHFEFFKDLFPLSPADIPVHYVPSSEKLLDLILAGLAYGMIPDLQDRDLLAAGRLTDLAPDRHTPVTLYWHRWNLSSALLDEFSKAIVKNAVIL